MKAILVIDVEEDMIGEVDYTILTKENMCNGRTQLKPMPQKKYAIQGMKGYSTTVKRCEGYNKCIDDILGGTE